MIIYFIGIGGIGVSALAQYYLANGHQVMGSDLAETEIIDLLSQKGAKVFIGQDIKSKIKSLRDANLIIYSPAVPQDNLEIVEAKRLGIECLSYPEALGKLTEQYFTIAVSGAHGKSTTTAMLALILIKAGLDPTVIVGTKLKEFQNSNFRFGQSKYLLIEADEWQASFLNYWPKIIVLTNIEEEHLDYYRDLEHILETYREYLGHLPSGGRLIFNATDENIHAVILSQPGEESFFGFSMDQPEVGELKRMLKVPGEHNIKNALAALATARALGIDDKISFSAIGEFKGTWRRFDERLLLMRDSSPLGILGTQNDRRVMLISDYGHHPTEVKATLQACKEKYPDKKICCVFQPHQYQRTHYLFDKFVEAFRESPIDKLIITDIFDVAGRENQTIKDKVSAIKLIEAIDRPWAIYLPQSGLVGWLKNNLSANQVLLIMGAGDIYKLSQSL